MDTDFSTERLHFKATERLVATYVDPRGLFASPVNPLESLARVMARVATPYWPCSDLPRDP